MSDMAKNIQEQCYALVLIVVSIKLNRIARFQCRLTSQWGISRQHLTSFSLVISLPDTDISPHHKTITGERQ